MTDVLPLDHLVLATPDLAATSAWFSEQTGVVPTAGGQHVGFGTRNELVALSESTYLEIVGPDAEQDEPSGPRPFGIDELAEARLVTFAVKAERLDDHVTRCALAGLNIGAAINMSRAKPDGSLLAWCLTVAPSTELVRPIPFLIDWRGAPSPALTSAQGISLGTFHAESPDASTVARQLETLGVDLDVHAGESTRLLATLTSPRGSLELS